MGVIGMISVELALGRYNYESLGLSRTGCLFLSMFAGFKKQSRANPITAEIETNEIAVLKLPVAWTVLPPM